MCAVFALTVLFYRTRPGMLLAGLPILISALLCMRARRWERKPRNAALRLALSALSIFPLSLFTLSALLEHPQDILRIFQSAFDGKGSYSIYYIYSALPDGPYLATAILLLSAAVLLHRFAPRLLRRLPARALAALRTVSTVALFAAFLVTLFHFVPQFPTYASEAIRKLFNVR